MQARASGGAVVVDIVDGDPGHTELVEHTLATGAVTVAVAGHALINIIVVDLGIKHGLDTSLKTELGVVDLATGLDELGHAHAEDVNWCSAFDHIGGICGIGLSGIDGMYGVRISYKRDRDRDR